MNKITTYLRQEYGTFSVEVGRYDVPLSLEFSPNLVLKGMALSPPHSSDSKVHWLWKKDSEALPVSFRFQLLYVKE